MTQQTKPTAAAMRAAVQIHDKIFKTSESVTNIDVAQIIDREFAELVGAAGRAAINSVCTCDNEDRRLTQPCVACQLDSVFAKLKAK